jgi:stress response protein SCP2
MTAPNIVAVATISGKTAVQAVGTSATAIVTNSSGSGKVQKVNALYVSNINTAAATVNVDIYRSTTAYRLAYTVSVPAGSTLDLMSKSMYLEEGDSLRLTASSSGYLEAVCSYEEIS